MSAPHKDRPALDHSLLSPSGKVSKRARDAALKRETARIFPPGYFDSAPLSVNEEREQRARALDRSAANLRDLAARGMSPRRFVRDAERLEANARALREAKP